MLDDIDHMYRLFRRLGGPGILLRWLRAIGSGCDVSCHWADVAVWSQTKLEIVYGGALAWEASIEGAAELGEEGCIEPGCVFG